MKLGFIIPTYSNEKRVALLPEHIKSFENSLVIEKGFGQTMNISDQEYIDKGCSILSREDIFSSCNAIFCLKLLQPSDYHMIRNNQMIIGWTHPTGSGRKFMKEQAYPKRLKIVDLDNIYPSIYYDKKVYPIKNIPRNFIKRNSFMAGFSATMHALMAYGSMPNSNTNVAILSSGNVAQGAFVAISKFNTRIQMFYRKTMYEFYNSIGQYDIIINGIELDSSSKHIINKEQLKEIKPHSLIIDAAADAGNAIEGTHYTTLSDPLYYEGGLYFYEVNNAPTVFFRDSSFAISESFSKYVYSKDVEIFNRIINREN